MDTLILKNLKEISVKEGSSLSSIGVVFDNYNELIECISELTDDNLKTVTIKNSSGLVIANYENLVFVNETSSFNNDGTVNTIINLRVKTEFELLEEKTKELMNEIATLKETTEVHDAAIYDLGTAVSDIAGGV